MRRISIGDAQPGQILADDAVNAQQMLLLKKGTQLTEKCLRTLKSWGLDGVWIEQPDGDLNPETAPATDCRDHEAELTARFGDSLEDPVMAAICRSAVRIVSERC